MKAKPIIWRGMEFRSKLEARYFNHFKKLDWDFDYEPDVPGLIGYQPDFVLLTLMTFYFAIKIYYAV